ncbi:MAG: PspC domain-containing protein [Bacteroidaceae bacterium]|jgi:phage shock protein PspC (stress-responsive transcriptional regulator)|nr:PspC domain-containing protein [Bacteroidaceae bacterium]MBQ2290320.1 PspC domain-containing protein [Bacteroidaceae bacterium]
MRKLVRSKDKVFGGVCAGIADFFKWDVRLLRLIWVVLSIVGVGSLVVFYLLLWMLMPDAANEKTSYEERMNKRLGK